MALGKRISKRILSVKLVDGTAVTPNEVEVEVEGNVTWTEQSPYIFRLSRGSVTNGDVVVDDDVPLEFSVESQWISLVGEGGDSETVYEAINQQGNASAWVSTGDDCDPYCLDLVMTADNSGCSSSADETITFPKAYVETKNFGMDEGSFNFEGRCKAVKPTIARA